MSTRAIKLEHTIINEWNQNKKTSPIDYVIAFLKKNGFSGLAKHLGSDTYNVTSSWKTYFPYEPSSSSCTPKTDILIGKDRISLKSGKSSQLMSGNKHEATATIFSALKNITLKAGNKIKAKINPCLKRMSPSMYVCEGNLKEAIKKGEDKTVKEQNKLNVEFRNVMKEVMDNNRDFAYNIIYEAMSGKQKFGDSNASATHCLVVPDNVEKIKCKEVTDREYIDSIIDKTTITVRFKSDSVKKNKIKTGEYAYRSVIAMTTSH